MSDSTPFRETDEQTISKLNRIIDIWNERKIFHPDVLQKVKEAVGMKSSV